MTIAELLAKHGIKLESTAPGRHYTTCPRCSKDRSKQKEKCLGVTIDNEGVRWGCNHCGWTGPEKGSGERPTKIEITYNYHDADGLLLFQKVRNPPGFKARFYCRRPDGNGRWINNTKDISKPLYRLPEIIEAIKAGREVALVEGEKDANNLWALDIPATCNFDGALDVIKSPNGKPKWKVEYSEALRGADLSVFNDNDPPGFAHADVICRMSNGVAKRVRRLDLKNDWPEIPPKGDVSDWLAAGGTPEKLKALIAAAPDYASPEQQPPGQPPPDDDAELEKLARMATLDYERARKDAGKLLGISRLALLDTLVKAKRLALGLAGPTPPLYEHWKVTPADDPVEGAILLGELKEAIQRYVFMSEDQVVAAALWLMFSWLHDHMTHSPILFVTSAERDSGKTTLLGVLNFLTCRGLQSVSITGPALFRSITKWQPTLIVDEADNAFVANLDLRDVINAGWTRGQGIPRCDPVTHEVAIFNAFAPKIVAMKGRNVPDTTLSRAIVITMKPRRAANPKEHVADFDHLDNETFARLRAQLMRWAADTVEAIAKATPEIPPGFQNRRRANWKPLLAIAELVGWKTAAWAAAKAIERIADTFDASISVELLQAVKAIFAARISAPRNSDRIKSEDLVDQLIADATAPWATYNKGKPISQRQVAGLLKGYEIRPKVIRLDDGSTPRGYLLEWFIDAFDRFCEAQQSAEAADPPSRSATSATDLFSKDFSRFSSATSQNDVADKKDGKASNINDVAHVADGEGGAGITSTPLDYYGPVVEVPDMGPDPFDQHGNPVAPGLSEARRRELADWWRKGWAAGGDPEELADALRMVLREEMATPEQAAAAFREVMAALGG
jgi:hypothetical protein